MFAYYSSILSILVLAGSMFAMWSISLHGDDERFFLSSARPETDFHCHATRRYSLFGIPFAVTFMTWIFILVENVSYIICGNTGAFSLLGDVRLLYGLGGAALIALIAGTVYCHHQHIIVPGYQLSDDTMFALENRTIEKAGKGQNNE